jgi:hypothetical protein
MIDPNKMYKKTHKKSRGFELGLLDLEDLLVCQIKNKITKNYIVLHVLLPFIAKPFFGC